MKHTTLSALVGLSLLAGCASLPPFIPGAPGVVVANGDAIIRVTPRFASGNLSVQAIVKPYEASDIHHLTLQIFKVEGNKEIPVADAGGRRLTVRLSKADIEKGTDITRLWANATYRIKAQAFGDAEEKVLLSADGSVNHFEVKVGGNQQATKATITITLRDRVFDGGATSPQIGFTPGFFTTDEPVTMGLKRYVTDTYAGNGSSLNDDPKAIPRPVSLAFDDEGNLYVSASMQLLKVSPDGMITSVYPSDGPSSGSLSPGGLAYHDGTLYVAMSTTHRIEAIDLETNTATILAGSDSGDSDVMVDDTGTAARFHDPQGMCFDGKTYLYVADRQNHAIRRVHIETGAVETIAGTGSDGLNDGPGKDARFDEPFSVAHLDGKLYVADLKNYCIRVIDLESPTFDVETVAGSTYGYQDGVGDAAQFKAPTDVAVSRYGGLYVSDASDNRIRMIDLETRRVFTVAGDGESDYRDGTGDVARFWRPFGMTTHDKHEIFVADTDNHRVRRIIP